MKILYLHQFDLDLAGGSGTYLRLVCDALVVGGHDARVVSSRKPDRYGLTMWALPFDVRLTFGPQRRDGESTFDDLTMSELQDLAVSGADAISEHLFADEGGRWSDIDLVLVNHISLPAEIARQLRSRHGTPYRIISYGTDTQLLERDQRYVECLLPAARDADRVFAISNFVAEQARAVVPGVAVHVLGGAVDKTVFRSTEHPGMPGRIVFVGRLVSEKGVWTLLDAMGQLDGVTLDVVGEGPLMAPLRHAVAQDGLRDRVRLLGYLAPEAVRDVLARATAAVMPSLWEEPLGLVAMEAIACGVPVVATAVGGVAEVVEHGRTGLLVPPNDADALATAIRRILDEPGLRERFRKQCLAPGAVPTSADLARKVLE